MRSFFCVVTVLVICGLAGPAAGAEPETATQAMFTGLGGNLGYAAPACAAPGYGTVPGCCEFRPSCCDGVWDGYCQKKGGGWKGFGGFCRLRGRCWGHRLFRPVSCRPAAGCADGCAGGCAEPACNPSEEGPTAPSNEPTAWWKLSADRLRVLVGG